MLSTYYKSGTTFSRINVYHYNYSYIPYSSKLLLNYVEIVHAFQHGNYEKALKLLPKVRDYDVITEYFNPKINFNYTCTLYNVSLLHVAAYHGWFNICHQLITKHDYDPHVQGRFGSLVDHSRGLILYNLGTPPPPLFYATLGGHSDIVDYLITECNCDPHKQSKDGEPVQIG